MSSVPTTSAEIREAYLKFFEEKGCQRWPSSSLIPDDPSLLLTVAGMVQFKPYFLQQKHLDDRYIGATTAQKCVRTNDIDIIGTDGRHLSFFEMLGNFSFGKYFKKEMCAWAYEFSTEVLKLEKDRIHVTVFTDDDEAAEIWEKVGVAPDHITRLGEDDNFWVAGPTGPCGPCSEMYYDQGPEVGCGRPDCAPGCDCDRFLEYWNLVFTQFDRQEDGSMVPLAHGNIDTGMGLERVAGIMQGVVSNFDTDILRGLVGVGERLSGKTYGTDEKVDLSLRIMADHSRAITFMVGDGILPSNEGRGYILRRLLRRAVRHGRLIGIEGPFLKEFLDAIVEEMGPVYPEIVENKALIEKVLESEEERFSRTIDMGEKFLDDALEGLKEGDTLDGVTAFTLHDTYGFPFELTAEICAERGINVDKDGFDEEMTAQRERARAARNDEAWKGFGDIYTHILDTHGATEFVGYGKDDCDARIIDLIVDGKIVDEANEGDEVTVILDKTPFYGEMGGQVGDTGTIFNQYGTIEVKNTTKPEADLAAHTGVITAGTIRKDDNVHAEIDKRRRALIARNHTATHILQAALVKVLGDHVKQAGSLVAPDRLRFDFTHFEPMTHEQILEVERICNNVIMSDAPVLTYETSLTAAREAGVTALFGEKYGEFVRVVETGSFSKELCGGTHVGHTSEIGLFKIVQETSIAANTRRIEAVTSLEAYKYMSTYEEELRETARFLKIPPLDVCERVMKMQKQLDEYERVAKRNKKIAAEGSFADYIKAAVDANGYKLVIVNMGEGGSVQNMREGWDIVKQRAQGKPFALVVFAISADKGTPIMLAAGNDAAVAAGFNANDVIKQVAPLIGGGGGGKPTMAQAGGKNAEGIDAAIAKAKEILGA
ncbi:MAG: alanine--tRNA ligase [Coriobacteriaceae bacterium]|nr:alanine--tRNA ligase [Coriobacteriaceae bacterium]